MNGAVVVQLGVDCVAAASLYALVALAVSLAYSGSGTYHLAIGQVGVAGGLIAAAVLQAGWPVWVAVVAGLAVGAALSAAMERGLVAPASGRPVLAAVLLIAAAVVTRELLQGLFPRSAYSFPSTSGTFRVLGGLVHTADLVTIAAVVAVAATGAVVLRSTTLGAALRLVPAARLDEVVQFAQGGSLPSGIDARERAAQIARNHIEERSRRRGEERERWLRPEPSRPRRRSRRDRSSCPGR